jgi:hypothetical protein
MPSKKKKPEPEPEPEPVEEPEEDEDEDEEEDEDEDEDEENNDEAPAQDDPSRIARLKASRRNARAKARATGYRKWANEAGLEFGKGQFSTNLAKTAFSSSDIERMARWAPQAGDVGLEIDEFKTRVFLRDQSISSGPLGVLHANVESFARKICKDVTMRALESGSTRITAAHVRSVLRPFQDALDLDFATPVSAVRHAQNTETGREDDEGNSIHYLAKRSGDDEEAENDKKNAKQNHSKVLKQADATIAAAREQRKAKKRSREGSTIALATASV